MVSQTVIVMVVSPLLHIIENGGVPPVIEANNVAQSGGVIVVSFPAFTTGESNTVTFIVSLLVVQLAPLTRTQYVPLALTNNVCAVELSDHKYVSNPAPASSSKPPKFEQNAVSFPKSTLHGGSGPPETLTVTVSIDTHPFASVTVTM